VSETAGDGVGVLQTVKQTKEILANNTKSARALGCIVVGNLGAIVISEIVSAVSRIGEIVVRG
jgi:hypothetical protein